MLEQRKQETIQAQDKERCLLNKIEEQLGKVDENQENFQMKDITEKLSIKDIDLIKKEDAEDFKHQLLKSSD